MSNDHSLDATKIDVIPAINGQTNVWDALNAGGGGGGGGSGNTIVRKFPFAFNDAGLAAGLAIYTPTVGDILLDCWVQVDTAWDGTTPFCDVGTFVGANTGIFRIIGAPAPLGLSVADTVYPGFGEKIGVAGPSAVQGIVAATMAQLLEATGAGTPFPLSVVAALTSLLGVARVLPALLGAGPIKVCVSQDGTAGGTDPGSTVGSGVVYLVTATPA